MEDQPDFKAGIRFDTLEENQPLTGSFGNQEVTVVRQGQQAYAVSARCTHLGADLGTGLVAEGEIRCPFHHARFDLRTGEATGAPAITPLGCFQVEITDGLLRVTGKRAPAAEPQGAAPKEKIVIIGAGAAGHALADRFVTAGQGAKVTLISEDAEAPYDRTFVSKQVLSGMKAPEAAALPFAHPHNPQPVLLRGISARKIDRQARQVHLSDGQILEYDSLVLATGAVPVRPDFEGADHAAVFTLRTLSDARAIMARAETARSIVVLGSSFIGLEAAGALAAEGRKIHVVTRDQVPMEKTLGREIGHFVQRQHESDGVAFHLGTTLTGFDGAQVTLENGHRLEADLVILGIGVAPDLTLAKEAGLDLAEKENGVLVDAQFRSSDPAIFAIGDIANYPACDGSGRLRIEHWAHAADQGAHLAAYLMGQTDQPFDRIPFFWTKQGDAQLRYVGHGVPSQGVRVDGDLAEKDFAAHIRGSFLHGALLTCNRDMEALQTERDWEA
ncbi:FAD-dependent oxidoreductase [Thioclava sp. GXIMD4216]|uniref:FAD-dependent oxidoreductase n=1 Tax=Thioclava sp. GXIMD4216 TaxID=3131929 RepID=UPI0030D1B82E